MRTCKAETDWYMNYRLIALFLAMLGAVVFVPSARAQGRGAPASGRASRPRTGFSRGGGVRTRIAPLRRTHGSFAASGYASGFYPDYYPDYDSAPGISEVSAPEIVEQAAASASPAPMRTPAEPLVVELQGDHWVRITSYGQPQIAGQFSQPEPIRASNQPPAKSPAIPRRTQAAEPPTELPPAVLVFRDGHKEEIGNYMIMDATIYTTADYWSSGSWTRKVQIVDLDVPATMKLNQERGAKFSLPSGPSEVMIRL